jgi:TM2 domain-containing membrane protein YozV
MENMTEDEPFNNDVIREEQPNNSCTIQNTNKSFKQKFKEGANKPETTAIAKMFFLFWTVFGFLAGGVQSFMLGSWGLGIALCAFSGLQGIGFFMEFKAYKSLKETLKAFNEMSKDNEMKELI